MPLVLMPSKTSICVETLLLVGVTLKHFQI
uniref:Uncharacterized protein n=1 Tax=Rhizophora mucronata TaxID=61149 RepID=A0A2P2QGD9_RHIMU